MATLNARVDEEDAYVYVYDRRSSGAPEVKISTGGLFTFSDFKDRVCAALKLQEKDKFVIATTNREEISDDKSWDHIDKGDTLYILTDLSQELCAPAEERVNYLPHYDTIVKGGMYEYYASEGQNPLPYAFAELIDNALAATVFNTTMRSIEIRLHFDENPQRSCIIVLDNGKGMTPRQLNNWAIYRLSKFTRRDKTIRGYLFGREASPSLTDSSTEESISTNSHVARYMNSDISYFGVGGKQAIFFIGNATRMISKSRGACDVHELTISKEEFEKREKNNEAIYSGYIRNRKPGDTSHLPADDDIVARLIAEETERDSFTAVVIQNIVPEHIVYLKQHVSVWTRQLAHIYHFYLHGPDGNVDRQDDAETQPAVIHQNIDIKVKLHIRGHGRDPQTSRVINLHDITDDMQTLFVRSSAATFEFKAIVDGSSAVEGVLRYHPFLYDRETYPSETFDPRVEPEPEDDHGYAINEQRARGKRPIFECFWNGRLIPYTLIEDFDWCSLPKKNRSLPVECYNRISGVLWTNDSFQVSTNKLTYLDLEMRLRDKNTAFTRVFNGHDKRTQIDKEFLAWLKECHEKHDKQILFAGFKCVKTRVDLPRHRQYPWSVFQRVEWDGRTYKEGQMVRILRTTPTLLGTIRCFLLYGDYSGDVYSTGGEIEISQEPVSLYNDVRVVPLSKLDRLASQATIKHCVEEEEAKLPDQLLVSWPNGQEVTQNEKRPAGKTIGDIKVEIINKKKEKISKIPSSAPGTKKLLVELKVIWHAPQGDEVIVSHISQHGKNWPYWFRKMENMKNLGAHTIELHAVLNESGATTYAGRELPSHKIKFTIVEAEPEQFTVGLLDGPFKVGVPFSIPLEFQDKFRNPTKPPARVKPSIKAEGLELTYDGVLLRNSTLFLKNVVAKGSVPNSAGKNFNLDVSIEGMHEMQSMKIRLMPGPPASMTVSPEEELGVENGSAPTFTVSVFDIADNLTCDGKLVVTAKFSGAPSLPTYSVNCNSTGVTMVTGEPICLEKLDEKTVITATFQLQGYSNIPAIERKLHITPSGHVSSLEVFRELEDGKLSQIQKDDQVEGVVGETIQGLRFRILDEGGQEIKMDDKMVNKVKVNWVPKPSRDAILAGRLPDIKVPTSVSDWKYCHVSVMDGNGVDFHFSVRGLPGKATRMQCKVGGQARVELGHVLEADIVVTLTDTYGNVIQVPPTAVKELVVASEDLMKDQLKIALEGPSLVVQNVQFDTQRVGLHRLSLSYSGLQDIVPCDVVSGPPVSLDMPDWNPEMPVTVYTDNELPFPVKAHLLDAQGNPSHTADIRVHITKDAKFKLLPSPQPLKTNAEGIADFGKLTVSGPTGVFEFQLKATVERNIISGPKIRVSIQPDPMKPRELQVDYSKNASFVVGQTLPEFTVKVIAEDDSLLNTTTASHISMKVWKSDSAKQNTPPAMALSLSPDTPSKSSAGVFVFRNHTAPEGAGAYFIMFVYFDGKYELYSSAVPVNLKAGQPVKLCPQETLGMPTVSNTRSPGSRCLLRNLKLQLQDKYDNLVTEGYDGEVILTILGPGTEIPTLVGGTRTSSFPMKNGQATLQNVTIQENSPGKDGMEYSIHCTVSCSAIPRNRSIPVYNIPFLFYNDAKKQSQMAALSKERESLQATIQAYKTMFQTQRSLVDELRVALHDAAQEEQNLRAELRKQNIPDAQLEDIESVEKLIGVRIKERDQILSTPRRTCGLAPAPDEPDVLGKIGHLALIENSDIARVISWHMSADMDCVVTYTTKKAQEIYSRTQGRQQVLPLDSIFRKNLPDWSKPLPHVRYRPTWKPAGQPMYARNLLQFPSEQESCRLVFGMLLGDTLILDNLEHANAYRQEIIKHSHCPTILTWQGDRIRSNGKFGGTMNKAVSVEKLRGAVFGQPLPMAYHALCTQIESLEHYKEALVHHVQAQDELQEVIVAQKQPEMAAKYKECQEAETQLLEVERQLGVGPPSRLRQAVSQASGHESNGPTPAKRSRGSVGSASNLFQSPLNGSMGKLSESDPSLTPTRTSLRIASMTTVVSDDGRKRLRKT
ncbi:structural maintenance of chromosomes flexible hinge domain-containing protein 1-like isoform X1 [Pomacea canaliculata]|uniref:structural maintenance of chromosomes flexible hinge domain-containing protein 1-like isoform X1 n=1 Tax=Pomacea canaliculata TaxID=400727 RepID=UPI000D72AA68|nr:structural maintenance of chromosomes flexible hinge domain-containing protein 1-like isoform X1 [Pomacea canaliculata]